MTEIVSAVSEVDFQSAAFSGGKLRDGVQVKNYYHFECFDKDGNLKWEETIGNVVTNEGLNDLLTQYLKGSSYTAAFYVGLIIGGTSPIPAVAAGDTATTHSGWTEFTTYVASSPNVRPTLTLGTVASQSVDNSASKASYTISTASPDSQTIAGAFLNRGDSTIGGGSPDGVLYSAALFGAGNKVLNGGDTLNVTVTCTAASA